MTNSTSCISEQKVSSRAYICFWVYHYSHSSHFRQGHDGLLQWPCDKKEKSRGAAYYTQVLLYTLHHSKSTTPTLPQKK